MNYQAIIDKYYPEDNVLKHILLTHSQSVAQRALQVVSLHPELALDRQFVMEAAMLHDIGIYRCHAPGIECYGTEDYIQHGRIGADILRAEGFPRHARVCERHTGAGLPGFLPETLEEKLVCYADKFYSKTRLDNEKTIDEAERSLAKFGNDGVERFREWVKLFE